MNDSSPTGRPKYSLILCLAICIVYFNSLTNPFIFDDVRFVFHSDWISSVWPLNAEVFQTRRPLLFLSLILNYAIGGTGVLGYHVFNIAIHIAATLTLFALCKALLKKCDYEQRRSELVAFAISLVWCVHPLLTVES